MVGEQAEDRVRAAQGLLQDVRFRLAPSFVESLADSLFAFRRKKAFEKKRREQDLAAIDKSRGEDEVGESSVELGLLTI